LVAPAQRFQIFVIVSVIVFSLILRFATRKRQQQPGAAMLAGLAIIVVVGGMYFAVFGQKAGWPWWVYYTVPALMTLFLPPGALRMSRREALPYLALALLSSPAIHVVFSLVFDWHEYMPFLRVPSFASLL
jgi:peptidoglycan/LPS O-acetylase OafA/YrhL